MASHFLRAENDFWQYFPAAAMPLASSRIVSRITYLGWTSRRTDLNCSWRDAVTFTTNSAWRSRYLARCMYWEHIFDQCSLRTEILYASVKRFPRKRSAWYAKFQKWGIIKCCNFCLRHFPFICPRLMLMYRLSYASSNHHAFDDARWCLLFHGYRFPLPHDSHAAHLLIFNLSKIWNHYHTIIFATKFLFLIYKSYFTFPR